MLLRFTKNDEDLKFLFYCHSKDTIFELSDFLSLETDGSFHDGLDAIITHLFNLYKEDFTPKRLSEFKRLRKSPVVPKGDFSLINTLCYINTLKDVLTTGSLKNKEPIDKYTKILWEAEISFDPDFLLLEIRTGLIKSIDNAEGLDKLYSETVQSNKEYFICSGLKGVYKKEELQGNTYLFLVNIKKVKFKHLESEGMICCTEDAEKTPPSIEALKTTGVPGTRIELENQISIFSDFEYGKVDLSKNAFKLILSDFRIIENHLCFRGQKVTVDGNYVITKTVNGPVR